MKKSFKVKGMHCNSCAERIEKVLKDRVEKVQASYSKESVEIVFDEKEISEKEIKALIEQEGYECFCENEISSKKVLKSNKDSNVFGWIVVAASLGLLLYFLYKAFGGLEVSLPEIGQSTSFLLLFVAGLLTGFHCIAMCGGFMISYTAKNAVNGHKSFFQHLIYGGSKTLSYTIIGALFGLIGSVFFFSPSLRGGIAIFAGIFMVFYSLSMFGFKFFRKFQFNPKFLTKIASKKYSGVYFGPMMTGLLNGLFIACGPLQALYLYAAGTGSMVQGGLSLMVFGLGTLPVMLGFGGFANVVSASSTRKILRFSAIIVLILGLIMLNRGLALTGSGYDANSLLAGVGTGASAGAMAGIVMEGNYQIIEMEVNGDGWSPDNFVLMKDVPVKWKIKGVEINGCNNAIQVPKLNLKFDIKQGEQIIEFTPTETGVISWSCWMGMIPGTFIVTDDGVASQKDLDAVETSLSESGGCGCGR